MKYYNILNDVGVKRKHITQIRFTLLQIHFLSEVFVLCPAPFEITNIKIEILKSVLWVAANFWKQWITSNLLFICFDKICFLKQRMKLNTWCSVKKNTSCLHLLKAIFNSTRSVSSWILHLHITKSAWTTKSKFKILKKRQETFS